MSNLLTGQKALVTGAGRGVGPRIAVALAREGASVVLHYRSSRDGAEAAIAEIQGFGGTAHLVQAELMDEAQAARMVGEAHDVLGGLSIVVNNAAGFGPQKELASSSWQDLDDEWQAVVKPVVTVTHAALPLLIARQHGRIVNLSATLLQRPAAGFGAHAMAKSAVLAYTRTLAREVGPHNITVNAVSPGMALTEFSLQLPEAVREGIRERTPLRRLATPDDVAHAVLLFCTPYADLITGANIAPDGGLAVL